MDVVFASLDGWNAKLRDAMPPSAREAGGTIQLASVACCVQALEWPHKALPLCLMGGFDIVGTLSPSGVFPAAKREAIESIHDLDHAHDNAAKISELWSHYRADRPGSRAKTRALWEVSKKACQKGYAVEATMSELDARFGPGKWRAMVRFAVEQNDAIRACDNAKGSKHNVLGQTIISPNWIPNTLSLGCKQFGSK